MVIEDPLEDFRQNLQKELPTSAQVTKIEFEGPEIAIYAKKPGAFGDQSSIKDLAKRFRKRIVIRSDPEVRKPHDISEEEIRKIVPEEAEITGITFNETIGEVIIEAKKPGLVIGRTGSTLEEIRLKTFWRPTVVRTPPLKSETILKVRHAIQNSSEDRKAYLRTIGRRIHRPALLDSSYIRLTPLGGFREVGRMSMLVQTPESKVMIDCGVNVGATDQAFPRFDLPEFDLNTLDAVVITHSHLDHCLPPETPIQMANGHWKPIGDIKPGEFVTSYNWEIGAFEPAKCVGKTITHGHTERIEIKTPYHSIATSPNHRFFIFEGLELREIEAQDLEKNQLLPVQRPELQQLCKTKDEAYSTQHFELVPISSSDLAQILESTGILGPAHHRRSISDLPLAILDWYRRKAGYATRNTVEQLIEVLLARHKELETLKVSVHDDLISTRRALSLPRAAVAEATGLSIMQVQYREEGNLHDELTTQLETFIFNQIESTQDQIRSIVQKINHILSLNIDWYPIEKLRQVPNDEPLIDIEVLPNRSFVAKGIVVHNCGFTPFLFKYGYEGPVYCTSPTQDLMTMLQVDYLEVAQREGKLAPYSLKDIRKLIMHTIPLNYGEVTDIAPDIRLTLHNAGHILGSSIAHLHVGDGLYNLAYTGDFKFARSRLLEPAVNRFPRLETLIMESTYGAPKDLMPSRKNSERQLVDYINRTLERGGKVLIPVLAVGRAQELLVVIEEYMNRGTLHEAPVFVDGMIIEATAIHTAHPEYLARELRDKIFHQGQNPFLAEYFTQVNGHKVRDEILETGPCIILATSGMLTGGPSVEYFKQLANNPDNSIIFVSYQVEGTLGRRIQKGRRQLPFRNAGNRRQVVKIELQIHTVEGFSGHSDRRQLMNYVRRLQPKPERVLTCHGEASKCINLASSLHRAHSQRRRLETRAIQNFETVRLY